MSFEQTMFGTTITDHCPPPSEQTLLTKWSTMLSQVKVVITLKGILIASIKKRVCQPEGEIIYNRVKEWCC